jgi:hypothetical protein
MREALDAQVALLTGDKVGESDFSQYKGIGGLQGITEKYEAPLRKATAQIDTDVMRQTLLGRGSGETYAEDGRIITGYDTGTQEGQYRIEQDGSAQMNDSKTDATATFTTRVIDVKTGEIRSESTSDKIIIPWNEEVFGEGVSGGGDSGVNTIVKLGNSKDTFDALGIEPRVVNENNDIIQQGFAKEFEGILSQEQQATILKTNRVGSLLLGNDGAITPAEPIYKKDKGGVNDFYAPEDSFVKGAMVRTGDGMVDLVGDKRAVQEQVQNEDGTYSLQDTADQAGFRGGQFMGLSALAEDIGRGGQQRAREADIADVERLGGRATDAYRSQGDLGGALAEARAMGAGGSDKLSAIPADPLFDGVATNSLAARTALENANISAITGGRTGDYDPRALPPIQRPMYTPAGGEQPLQRALDPLPAADYQPSLERSSAIAAPRSRDSAQGSGVMSPGTFQISQQGQAAANQQAGAAGLGQMQGQGQQAQQYAQPGGTDAFRSALMQQGMGALDQGLSERENRAVQEAARARSTNMGRTFDQTASIDESRAVIEEDNARRMQNRAFAQSALGQEVGIQQADMARGLQAQQMELGRQSAGVDRQLTAEEKDIERQMRMQSMEEQYRQQGLGAERANAAQMVGLEQATSADPFQAILQRQGQNNLASGGAVFGQAGYGLNSGPQYLNPESGLGFIQNQATNAANMYGAQIGADATKTAGMWSGLGSLAGSLGGAAIMRP